jgi:hypothetical protein
MIAHEPDEVHTATVYMNIHLTSRFVSYFRTTFAGSL